MFDLLNHYCLPQAQLKLLTPGEIKVFLGELKHWEFLPARSDNAEGVAGGETHPPSHEASARQGKIVKEFIFNDFSQAMKFVNQVAELAEHEGHHPDIAIHYRTLSYEMPVKMFSSALSSKFGLKISNNFQPEPLAKPENSIKFLPPNLEENSSKAFHNLECKIEIILWTHFVKGLSINDFILAVKIDNL